MYHVCQSIYARGGIHTTTILYENALPFALSDPGIAVAEVAPRPNIRAEYASLLHPDGDISDLSRIDRFAPRPERNRSEISLHDAFRLRSACEAGSITVVMSSESCASLVSGGVLKLLEIVPLRL